jgi:hypothetical protein
MSGPANPTKNSQSHAGVKCAKCEHVNAHGRNVCEACGAHLHVVCHNCGHRNSRSRTHCSECGHKLHRSWAKRLIRKVMAKDAKGLQALLLVLAIVLGALVIALISKLNWFTPQEHF